MDRYRQFLRHYATRSALKDEETGLPKRYVAGLTASQKKEQVRAIEKSKQIYEKTGKVETRPKVSDEHKRSAHVIKFEKIYGFPITDLAKVKKEFPNTDIDTILRKGRAAYASSGSRPNQSPESWSYARLSGTLTGSKALAVDKDLVGDKDLKKILSQSK